MYGAAGRGPALCMHHASVLAHVPAWLRYTLCISSVRFMTKGGWLYDRLARLFVTSFTWAAQADSHHVYLRACVLRRLLQRS